MLILSIYQIKGPKRKGGHFKRMTSEMEKAVQEEKKRKERETREAKMKAKKRRKEKQSVKKQNVDESEIRRRVSKVCIPLINLNIDLRLLGLRLCWVGHFKFSLQLIFQIPPPLPPRPPTSGLLNPSWY